MIEIIGKKQIVVIERTVKRKVKPVVKEKISLIPSA